MSGSNKEPKDWALLAPGEWAEDRTSFPGSAMVVDKGDLVIVFFPENVKGLGGSFRFRRINNKLVRTG